MKGGRRKEGRRKKGGRKSNRGHKTHRRLDLGVVVQADGLIQTATFSVFNFRRLSHPSVAHPTNTHAHPLARRPPRQSNGKAELFLLEWRGEWGGWGSCRRQRTAFQSITGRDRHCHRFAVLLLSSLAPALPTVSSFLQLPFRSALGQGRTAAHNFVPVNLDVCVVVLLLCFSI